MPDDLTAPKVKEGRVLSRRELVAGGAAALAFGSAVAGPTSVQAQAPRKGGTARIATEISDATASVDPAKVFTNTDIARAFQLYNPLVRIDEKLEAQPSLAISWETAKADGTEWVFKLRRGVTFHNGRTLTAADVVWSMQRHMGAQTTSRAKSLMATVMEVVADDAETVRFRLSTPQFEFPAVLSFPQLVIVPEGHADFARPVGTGPFAMDQLAPGGTSSFVRYKDYWNAANVFLDRIEVVAIADPSQRLNAVLAGDLHFAMSADVTSVPILDKSEVAEKLYVMAGQCACIVMMVDREPGDNPDVRLALKLLQDRQRNLDGVYKGFAQIANDHPVSPTDPMYAGDLPIRAYDPDKARFHLKRAGRENLEIEMVVAPGIGPGVIDQALTFQQTAAPAGVKVKIRQVPGDGYWNQSWRKSPFTAWHLNMRARPDHMWSTILQSDSTINTGNFKDARIDNLLKAARAEPDIGKRKLHWHDLQKIVHDEAGYMQPVFPDYIHSKARALQGVRPHPTAGLSDFLSGEGWWLKA
jgi:peptide/nickel transport system substrate-binding protein